MGNAELQIVHDIVAPNGLLQPLLVIPTVEAHERVKKLNRPFSSI